VVDGVREGGGEDCAEGGTGGGAEDDGSVKWGVGLAWMVDWECRGGKVGGGEMRWTGGEGADLSIMVTMGAMRVEAQKAAMRSDVIRQGREEVLYCEVIVEKGAVERSSGNLAVKLESGVMKAAKREL
jgi:hypothetical protein